MGGGGGFSGIASGIGKGLGAIVTGGTSLIPGSPTKKIGDIAGGVLTLGASGGLKGALGGSGPSVPNVPGSQNPLQMLTSSGGAPLLTNIALGADVKTSIMGYFGASGSYDKWYQNLNPQDQQAIGGLTDQLLQIQNTTDLRNKAVSQLANDFPNMMAQKIPQYSAMADSATQQMMDQALKQISAKQAAGGAFSSGATAEAAANAGANLGMQKLQFGTGLALQDFQQQFNNATALQTFQQKMLGQGATQGFNAVQNALSRNAGVNSQQAQLQYGADQQAYQSQQGMYGALGQLGGTLLGGMFGGPAGAAVGGSIGSGLMGDAKLNLSGQGFGGSSPWGPMLPR